MRTLFCSSVLCVTASGGWKTSCCCTVLKFIAGSNGRSLLFSCYLICCNICMASLLCCELRCCECHWALFTTRSYPRKLYRCEFITGRFRVSSRIRSLSAARSLCCTCDVESSPEIESEGCVALALVFVLGARDPIPKFLITSS